MTHIKWVKATLLDGQFDSKVELSPGLNIIAGPNGTGKTKFLEFIATKRQRNQPALKHNELQGIFLEPEGTARVIAFSPIRSLQKTAIDAAYQAARAANASRQALAGIQKAAISDFQATAISGLSSYLTLATEELTESMAIDKGEAAAQVQSDYGSIVEELFGYTLSFQWDFNTRAPIALISKGGREGITPENLSTGETALLSLAAAIYFSRGSTDVYLIDEPEVHLNWSLEFQMFKYFDRFATEFDKQLIVTTHSRSVFTEDFSSSSQFFGWAEDRVEVSQEPTASILDSLAGDLSRTVAGLTATVPTLYVEDGAHEVVVGAVAEALGLSIHLTRGGNSSNVVKLARAFDDHGASGFRFLIDDDNQQHQDLPTSVTVLNRYCIENYLFDFESLDQTAREGQDSFEILKEVVMSKTDHGSAILREVLRVSPDISREDFTTLLDRVDGSTLLDPLLERLGFDGKKHQKVTDFLPQYLNALETRSRLEEHFADLKLIP